jgi:hypothetical protein
MSRKLTLEEKDRRISCNVRVSPEQMRTIDAMAKRERRSRSSMAALLLEWALREKVGELATDYLEGLDWNLKGQDSKTAALFLGELE